MSDFNVGSNHNINTSTFDVNSKIDSPSKKISKEEVINPFNSPDNINLSRENRQTKRVSINIEFVSDFNNKGNSYNPIHQDPWNNKPNYPSHGDNGYPSHDHNDYDDYNPIHQDPWDSHSNQYPINPSFMRKEYNMALQEGNPEKLFKLAKIENKQNLLSDVSAETILNKAFEVGVDKSDSRTLFKIAIYENDNNLLSSVTAENVMYSSYKSAVSNKDVSTLIDIARYEKNNNIMGNVSYDEIVNTINNIRYDY